METRKSGQAFQVNGKRGVFVTYSAMGKLKRDLRTVGFEVESLPGPTGKREMVRAIVSTGEIVN